MAKPASDLDIGYATGHELRALYDAGDLAPSEAVAAVFRRISAVNPHVNAFSALMEDEAMDAARASDARIAKGEARLLEGVPVTVKDFYEVKGQETETGSFAIRKGPAAADNPVLTRLREAGAVIMGKCVTTEFALSAPGKTRNPHDPECTPGGSSSGSAAAVADCMVPLAIGSQTGGSMLRPASYNGVYGLKPTFGTISRAGMSPLSRRLDHPGIFARTPEDVALAAGVLMRRDSADKDMRGHIRLGEADPVTAPPKIAFVRGPVWSQGDADMQRGIEDLARRLGPVVAERELPPVFERAAECHSMIMNGSVGQSLGPYYDRDKNGLDPITRSRVERGLPVTSRDYLDALYLAEEMQDALAAFFADFDAILAPAAPGQAPRDLARTGSAIFNGYWTLMGAPAASLPLLKGDDGLPIGVQLICPWGNDARLLKLCRWLADQTGEWK